MPINVPTKHNKKLDQLLKRKLRNSSIADYVEIQAKKVRRQEHIGNAQKDSIGS